MVFLLIDGVEVDKLCIATDGLLPVTVYRRVNSATNIDRGATYPVKLNSFPKDNNLPLRA